VKYSNVTIGLKRNWLMARVFSRFYPEFRDRKYYEEGLKSAINKVDVEIQNAIIIGGGYGVIAVYLRRVLGNSRDITIYEASERQANIIKQTLEKNSTEGMRIIVNPVGEAVSVYNQEHPVEIIPAKSLPIVDLLLMDCEGAEANIIDEMIFLPKVIIVETHGFLNSGTKLIEEKLTNRGYEVTDCGWAEPSEHEFCKVHDIRVLHALRIN
jgi:hypothetical protein